MSSGSPATSAVAAVVPGYRVVVNDEEQYSVWWRDRVPPAGWRPLEFTGSRDECLAYIDEVWTDLRPRSVRDAD